MYNQLSSTKNGLNKMEFQRTIVFFHVKNQSRWTKNCLKIAFKNLKFQNFRLQQASTLCKFMLFMLNQYAMQTANVEESVVGFLSKCKMPIRWQMAVADISGAKFTHVMICNLLFTMRSRRADTAFNSTVFMHT